ncbi:MAG: family ATPase, partial [Solirubrobacterales bacterium]|nr:family ATPase [Solirubrobacterales bacterium]
VEQADSVGATLEAARNRLVAGRALAGSDREAAIEQLSTAAQVAGGLGAHRVHDEALRELRRLGVRRGRGGARATEDTGLGSLSDRERAIADLVVEGRTNREIGARLYLSEKTIETHLSRVFRKLEVRSRAEVAARVATGDD